MIQVLRFLILCICCFSGSYFASFTNNALATNNPAATFEQITTKKISIIDKNGATRIGIGFDDGVPVIGFFREDKSVSSYYCSTNDSSYIAFKNGAQKTKLTLGCSEDYRYINFYNANDQLDLTVASMDKQGSSIYFRNRLGIPRMAIAISNNQPRIGMFDENKRLRVMFGMSPEDSAVLGFVDKNGYPELALARYFDKPLFMLTKPGGDGIYASKAKDGEPVLFHRENRKIDWSIPAGQPGRAGELEGLDPKDLMKGMLK